MNRPEAKNTILTKFMTDFNETTPVSFDNRDDFYKCTNPMTRVDKPTSSPWVRFCVDNNVTKQRTFGKKGNRRWRRTGFISSQVFIPEGVGTAAGDDLCNEIINIFEGENLDNIWFEYGYPEEIGMTDDRLFQFNIIIYFSFDETK